MIKVHFISTEERDMIESDFKKIISESFNNDFNVSRLLFTLASILTLFSATGIRLKAPERFDERENEWKDSIAKVCSCVAGKLREKEESGALSVEDVVSAFFEEAKTNYILLQSEDFKAQK